MKLNISIINKTRPFLRLLSRYKYIILLVYFFAIIVYILSPIFHEGCLCSTDFVNNLLRAQFMNHNLARNFCLDQWTYKQYLGFQPFLFYFPGFFMVVNLIHILTFGLIPLIVIYKMLILASFLILPVSVYYCMRTFNFRKSHAFFSAIFSLASGTIFGYGFENLTFWGMDVQFFVISFIPLVLALYHKLIKSETLHIYLLFSLCLLFAFVAVTHLQTALHLILVLFIYNVYIFSSIKNKLLYIKKNIIILFMTCLLAGFWYFPVLRFYDFFGALTTTPTGTLFNGIRKFLTGDFLTIQPIAILFVVGLILLVRKSKKRRYVIFFPVSATVVFVIASVYYSDLVDTEFFRHLFNFFTFRSYPMFCLLLSFISGFALGEMVILIRKYSYLLTTCIRKKLARNRLSSAINGIVTLFVRIFIFTVCVYFLYVSLTYMFGFRDRFKTESDMAFQTRPTMMMGVIEWLKTNAGKNDLIAQFYDPFPELSSGGNLSSIQYRTGLPIFGGGHFESSDTAVTFCLYDNENFFKNNNPEYIHFNLVKFNIRYLVYGNQYRFFDKLVSYDKDFDLVYKNSLYSILKINDSNNMLISHPGKNGIQVLGYEFEMDRSTPRLSWQIDNTISGNIMTLSISYLPKWKVQIDGEKIKPKKNNDAMLVIPLRKKGVQTVILEYRVTFLEQLFNVLSLVTLLFIMVMFIRLLIIKRREISLLKRRYWEDFFSKPSLTKKAFLAAVAIAGIAVMFISISMVSGKPLFGSKPIIESEEIKYVNTVWRFSFKKGDAMTLIADRLVLLPNRKIAGGISDNEDHWAVENGILVFYNKSNTPTTRFTGVTRKDNRDILEGKYLLSFDIVHILQQVE
jgi:hypothetical protein